MTGLQSWVLAAFGVTALATGVLLAGMAGTFAQEGTPTPTPSEQSEDGGDTETPDTEDADSPRNCAGGKHLIIDAAAEVLGMTEDELRETFVAGQALADTAQAQGMDVATFEADLVAAVTADLQAQLSAGEITQEEYDDITADLAERVSEIVNREPGSGAGFGHRGPGGRLGVIAAAAEVLGLIEDEVRTALDSGQTLAEIAEANGFDAATFQAALVENLTADLQARLDAGEITQEQFDDITAELADKVDDIVNREPGARFPGGPRGDNGANEGTAFGSGA